jgi:hypothetical protein
MVETPQIICVTGAISVVPGDLTDAGQQILSGGIRSNAGSPPRGSNTSTVVAAIEANVSEENAA